MTFTDSQQTILDAVIKVVARDGIEGASMRSVATEADVSVGLLSYHFDDKQSLIVAAFSRENDRALEALATVTDQDGVGDQQRVRAYIRASFTDDLLAPDYLNVRISLWGMARTDPDMAALERALHHGYAHGLVDVLATARPELSRADVKQRVVDVVAAQNGLWLHWARERDGAMLERGLVRCERMALDGD